MRNVSVFVIGLMLAALLGWVARGRYQFARVGPVEVPRTATAATPVVHEIPARVAVPEDLPRPPAGVELPEAFVPVEVLAAIAPVPDAPPPPDPAKDPQPTPTGAAPRPIIVPVQGVAASSMHDTFDQGRGDHRHEAIDIMMPRGTPVIAADDGFVRKLFTSVPGGLTIYQYDPDERFCYYYAHLDRYATGLREGQQLHRGEIIGYVGSTGNASGDAPHLHFALIRLDPEKRWWKGTYVNPYPLLIDSTSH